ncbi:hypothetical protein EZV62_005590 [Acer yangbiense]|uniref:Uncharacterized protein n=1 Tax=Acer yangbiense TaxID=1000413 RepID=A0A5C7IN81_9ROSI|nr:hypothetical protein EZV62_005590 [Acer yangbiense]
MASFSGLEEEKPRPCLNLAAPPPLQVSSSYWEVVAARELSDSQSGTVKPSFYGKSASLRESPPAPGGHFRELGEDPCGVKPSPGLGGTFCPSTR